MSAPAGAETEGAEGRAGTTVAVIGLGVLGGSLVRALRALPERPRVLGASPDASDRRGAEREGARTAEDPAAIVGDADVVVYAAPLGAILRMIPVLAERLKPDALVTDVAGLKRPVLDAAVQAGLGARFVGGHPMAGSEGSGFEGGRAALFRDARVFLCADRAVDGARRLRIEDLWRSLAARPTWIGADDHDRLMTKVSQLPQLVANALALVFEQERVSPADLGPGGRDMTRLAQSPPAMWADLLAHTGTDVSALLRAVAARLEELAARLEQADGAAVAELMARTRAWRAQAAGTERGGR